MMLLLLVVAAVRAANVVTLTDDTFDAFVTSERATIVEFFSPRCGHCLRMADAYERAATILAPMRIAAVDATANVALAKRFGVRGYPTMLPFVEGRVQPKYAGGRSTHDFVALARSLVVPTKDEL
jgi:thiol-disulfide isomerase/thioredoxin